MDDTNNVSTEEKIKNAARIVFQRKGYAATRTRDIAEEAGINLALLNYYFRSKEKLFEIILYETVKEAIQSMTAVMNDEQTTFEEKITLFASFYIDKISKNTDVPIFIMNEFRNHPDKFIYAENIKSLYFKSVLFRQFNEKQKGGEIKENNMSQFILNLFGLLVIPFLAKPILTTVGSLNDEQFNQLLQERKRMIPVWIDAMLHIDKIK